METERLKTLIDLMNDNDLLELEIVEEGKKVRLKKMYDGATKIVPMSLAASAIAAEPVAAVASAGAAAQPAAGGAVADDENVVKSPMVGTFYRAANPENPPYVEVGDEVNPDSVVCILEAMKVFNEIKAETTGKIVEILAENGDSVEYGQMLFRIGPV